MGKDLLQQFPQFEAMVSSLWMGGVSGEVACGFPRFGGVKVVVDCVYVPLVLVEVNLN